MLTYRAGAGLDAGMPLIVCLEGGVLGIEHATLEFELIGASFRGAHGLFLVAKCGAGQAG